MKKLFSVLALALPLAVASQTGDALAQRANHTKKDVPVAYTDQNEDSVRSSDEIRKQDKHDKKLHKKHHDDKGGFDKKEHKKNKDKMKEGKHRDHMSDETREEIEENYSKAIHSIKKSSFNPDQKDLLTKQAQENRDLALRQMEDRDDMIKKHMNELKDSDGFKKAVHADKNNKKALKKIGKILD